MRFRPALAVALLIAAAATAAAQNEDPLANLRVLNDLNQEQRAQVRQFIEQRVTDLVGGDATAARAATQALRDAYTGTDVFRQAYAEAAVDVLGSAASKAELVPATRLLALLGSLRAPAARGRLLEALQDERVGVRAAGAIGLRGLHASIVQAGGDTYGNVLSALRDAGRKEKSREALRAIYTALDFTDVTGAPPQPMAGALLDLLDARSAAYKERQEIKALGADDAGLTLARALGNVFNDEGRKRLATCTAYMVRSALEQYTSPQLDMTTVRDDAGSDTVSTRNALERLVVVGEPLLASLLNVERPPTVLESMRKLDKAAMKLQWQEWNKILTDKLGQDFTLVVPEEPAATQPGGGG